MTNVRDQRPSEATVDFLRSAFPPQWREPALAEEAVAEWERENRLVLPEPYRTFITKISNGSRLGPAGDGGLQPLGRLPGAWPDLGPRQPGEPFPLEAAWGWEDDESVAPEGDPRIDAVFTKGSVVLGSEDGQSFWLLITTGRRRGEVWMVADVGAVPAPGDRVGLRGVGAALAHRRRLVGLTTHSGPPRTVRTVVGWTRRHPPPAPVDAAGPPSVPRAHRAHRTSGEAGDADVGRWAIHAKAYFFRSSPAAAWPDTLGEHAPHPLPADETPCAVGRPVPCAPAAGRTAPAVSACNRRVRERGRAKR
ncbi:SMI1/KNR4 family protein [Streptomyces sp. NPDC006193]|uniref:SMI1/KNR4 family protein n=1 Tax=Streptomyces sp. NPDC006193 TaxID=3155717 RepID=UPI0033B49A89